MCLQILNQVGFRRRTMSAITFMSKSFYPDDHGFLFSSRVMVYKAYSRYKYDVTYMMMTSLTSAARLLLRPTVALVDRDYQFLHAALSQQQQNDDEMSLSQQQNYTGILVTF